MSTTTKKPGRIAGFDWQIARPIAVGVFNGNYSPSGSKIGEFPKPWVAFSPEFWESFPTHAEAINYAFREAGR